MSGLEPVLYIAGIAGVSHLVQAVMEETGNGRYSTLINISAWCACAYIAWEEWWDVCRYVAHQFGVMI